MTVVAARSIIREPMASFMVDDDRYRREGKVNLEDTSEFV